MGCGSDTLDVGRRKPDMYFHIIWLHFSHEIIINAHTVHLLSLCTCIMIVCALYSAVWFTMKLHSVHTYTPSEAMVQNTHVKYEQ